MSMYMYGCSYNADSIGLLYQLFKFQNISIFRVTSGFNLFHSLMVLIDCSGRPQVNNNSSVLTMFCDLVLWINQQAAIYQLWSIMTIVMVQPLITTLQGCNLPRLQVHTLAEINTGTLIAKWLYVITQLYYVKFRYKCPIKVTSE